MGHSLLSLVMVLGLLCLLHPLSMDGHRLPLSTYEAWQIHRNAFVAMDKDQSSPSLNEPSKDSCSGARPEAIFDCYPEDGANEGACRARGCCWVPRPNVVNVPYCFFPTDYANYELRQSLSYFSKEKMDGEGFVQTIGKSQPSPRWPRDILTLKVEVSYLTSRVARVRITDPQNKRWEPPIPLNLDGLREKHANFAKNYEVTTNPSPYGVRVRRTTDNLDLFQTNMEGAPLIFSDQFIQISTTVPTRRVYGIGEQQLPFMHDMNRWLQIALYNHDVPPYYNVNLYGVHNFMLGMTDSGTAYGLFFLNSNAQEVILQPAPAVTYRTIGGVIDFFIFTAENPRDVVSDYWTLLGPPMLPPYWSLGFHLCRYGYKSDEDVRDTFMRNYKLNMPQDVQWSDIDYMERYLDWTIDPEHYGGLPDFVRELKEKYGKRYVVIVDPGISTEYPGKYPPFDEGLQLGVFVNKSDNSGPLVGKVWPGLTVFPDFTNPLTTEWWTKHMKLFYDKLQFSGLWIDMNEPSNFVEGSTEGCTQSSLDNPPYQPGIEFKSINRATVCASARQSNGTMYDLHNLYGYFESKVTKAAMRLVLPATERVFLLSRSTFAGSGRYTFHWTGDNLADWDNLYYSLVQVMNFNLYGIPMVGADICGFRQDTNEELCTRWMQAGTFYPFMRNHNDLVSKDQDPAVWGPDAQRRMRDTLRLRYSLLPYLYTQLFQATVNHLTVVHPLFFFYPNLVETFDIDTQFMMGPALMVAPVLMSNAAHREVFFPEGYWCNLHTLDHSRYAKGTYQVSLSMDNIPVYIRGGHVVSFQGWREVAPQNATTTQEYRELPFTFIGCVDDYGKAQGELIWDDGITYASVEQMRYNHLNYTVDTKIGLATFHAEHIGLPAVESRQTVHEVILLGVTQRPARVTVNGQAAHYTADRDTLRVSLQEMAMWDRDIVVEWVYS